MSPRSVVLDASAFVELLIGGPASRWIGEQLRDRHLTGPAHVHAEVLSALGRRHRSGTSTVSGIEEGLRRMVETEADTYPLPQLLLGAWHRRDRLRLADALYVELAAQLDTVVVTTDRRLARATPLAVAPPEE